MIKSNKLIALLLVLFSFVFCNQAISKTKFVSTQKYWNVYVTEIKKTKTCFITSEPTSTSGKFDKKIVVNPMFLLLILGGVLVMKFL